MSVSPIPAILIFVSCFDFIFTYIKIKKNNQFYKNIPRTHFTNTDKSLENQ